MKTIKNYFKQILLLMTITLLASCSSSDSDPIDEIPDVSVINYDVTNIGGSAYVFNNAKFTDSENPELTLERGETYTFTVNAPGHPFLINLVNTTGTENMYNMGVTNNGTASGVVTFTVPDTAPNTLYYNCEFHAAMTGKISIIGGTPETIVNYDVTNKGGSAYVFNNAKFTDSENPELTLERGKTYTFTVNAPGHPFLIKLINSTGINNMYNKGVVNNGTASGVVSFTVPYSAPNTLYYNCEFHAVMTGKILIIGGTPETIINYDVTNNGGSAYVFNNANFTNSENPNITLERGKTYTFTVNAPGHPFLIKSIQSTGVDNLYNGGVQNNGSVSGVLTFTVPFTAPDKLYYNCEFHAAMTGEITIN